MYEPVRGTMMHAMLAVTLGGIPALRDVLPIGVGIELDFTDARELPPDAMVLFEKPPGVVVVRVALMPPSLRPEPPVPPRRAPWWRRLWAWFRSCL